MRSVRELFHGQKCGDGLRRRRKHGPSALQTEDSPLSRL